MKELMTYAESMKRLPEGCLSAEAEAEKKKEQSVQVSDGNFKTMSCSEQTEFFIRASEKNSSTGGGRTGMVYTQKADEDPKEVILRAMENSRVSSAESPEPLCSPNIWEEVRQADKISLSFDQEEAELLPVAEMKRLAAGLEKEIREKTGSPVSLILTQTIRTVGAVNSTGLNVTGSSCYFTAEVSCGNEYLGFLSAQEAEKLDSGYFIRQILGKREVCAPKSEPKSGNYRLILSSAAVNFILITAWQMFSAAKLQSGDSPFAHDMGKQIFSDCITIRDLWKVPENGPEETCGFSFPVDCEGAPGRDLVLVKNGILTGAMHNLTTARKENTLTTGNGGRKALLGGNIHTDMTVIPKNFVMDRGNASLKELFAAAGDGIYIDELYDQFHSLNVASGDFTFPCRGYRIKDGKPDAELTGMSMNGNVRELFSKVQLLGKDREVCPFPMYSSYTVAGPAMFVKDVKIIG